jgi:fructokinase
MIAVAGEALIDLVIEGGDISPRPGGAAFNTARTLGRLGMEPTFLGRLSGDVFGAMLREQLAADEVTLGVLEPSQAPATLSVAELDKAGAASYRFYLAGTSAADLDYPRLAAALPTDLAAVHTGALGLVMEPVGSATERLVTSDLPAQTLVMLDPNCRPRAIADRDAYLGRIWRLLRRADIVKVSTEDLGYLRPGACVRDAAAELLAAGPALVLITDGPHQARAVMAGREIALPVPAVRVVDTIGAGDAFGGAFLGWWLANGLARADLSDAASVGAGLALAAEVAALTCTRPGAEPPWLAEVTSWCNVP